LFLQPDFVSQKSELKELIESRGHLCDFYPKYHCELNFIEQYWGAAKMRFCSAGRVKNLVEMEHHIRKTYILLYRAFSCFFVLLVLFEGKKVTL